MTSPTKKSLSLIVGRWLAAVWLLALLGVAGGCAHRGETEPGPTIPTGLAAGADVAAATGTTPTPPEETVTESGEVDDEYDDYDDEYGDDLDEVPAMLVADPIAPFNRAMFEFNDRLYFWAFKPVAQGYRAVLPTEARSGIRNFFYNIAMPVRFVNCLLQGKARQGVAELGRFALNTTVGVLGFGNPAARYGALNPPAEDLGQTLARYRFGDGFYIVWPVIGPSTLRDSVGKFGDMFLGPLRYATSGEEAIGIYAVENVNALSLRIGDYEALKEAAIEPYEAFRDAYIQYRLKQIDE